MDKTTNNQFKVLIIFMIIVIVFISILSIYDMKNNINQNIEINEPLQPIDLNPNDNDNDFICPEPIIFQQLPILSDIDKELLIQTKEYNRIIYIMNYSNPNLSNKDKINIADAIITYSKKYNLNSTLVASMIHRESNYKLNAVSSVGAEGLMQISFKTFPKHQEQLTKRNITLEDFRTNVFHQIDIGCEILADILKVTKGNISNALLMYNGRKGYNQDYVLDIFNLVEQAYLETN